MQDKFHSTLICELNHANFKDSICRIKYFIGAVVFFVETCLAGISKSKLDAVIMKNAILKNLTRAEKNWFFELCARVILIMTRCFFCVTDHWGLSSFFCRQIGRSFNFECSRDAHGLVEGRHCGLVWRNGRWHACLHVSYGCHLLPYDVVNNLGMCVGTTFKPEKNVS